MRAFVHKHFPSAVAARRAAEAGKSAKRREMSDKHHQAVQERKNAYTHEKKEKYAEAVKRFSTGEESAQAVAKACGINKASFCAYLRSHHPDLIENRQKVRSRQLAEINQLRKKADECARAEYELEKAERRTAVNPKYEPAVAVYRSGDIPLKVVARQFGFTHVSLRNYISTRYPELIAERAKAVENALHKKYEIAADEIMTSRESIETIAAKYGFSRNALRNYISRYRPDILAKHRQLKSAEMDKTND